jgi:Arc/MetJ family transcription regulator
MREMGFTSTQSGQPFDCEMWMAKTHTTLDLDRELLREAAEALGTTRTTETVHAALRDVVARRRRAWLARRDFSELEELLPEIRAPRSTTIP